MSVQQPIRAIHLHGDSIFDNETYVYNGEGELCVREHLEDLLLPTTKVTLFAVDGYVTTEAYVDMNKLNTYGEDTLAVLSCGGNDALRSSGIMLAKSESVFDSLSQMKEIINSFEKNYDRLLWEMVNTYELKNVRVCTVYNNIPKDAEFILDETMLALRLFNDVITETADKYNVRLIDLRNICTESSDYSTISSIEPSHQGGEKIAKAIVKSFSMKTVNCKPTSC